MAPTETTTTSKVTEFVILRHEMSAESMRTSHWDWMFAENDHLVTWAVDVWPLPHESVVGLQLPPHRNAYLEYEGPVSNDRGTVKQVVRGTARVEFRSADRFEARLTSDRLVGRVKLQRMEGPIDQRSSTDRQRWELTWVPD